MTIWDNEECRIVARSGQAPGRAFVFNLNKCVEVAAMPQETTANRQFEKQLALLVGKFAKHHDEYTRSDYSETEVRAEFIDPFFEALGWDLQNRAGHSPKTREVFREAGETHGRVDYVFRVDGRDVFYLEAKAPHVPLDRVDVVMQAKSYAWHSRDVFIAAVTDFEEFRLYDATAKPDRKHPNAGLIFEYRYNDYLKPKTLDDLWLLSRESVGAGSIDQLLKKSSVQARQRIPVDQAFLDDLSAWREQLAKAVFKANPDLSPADLNSIIQVFLDRLIFIRICEDRRIMDPRQLEEVARNWEFSGKRVSITNDLNALFHEVNERLNGEIFKPGHVEKIDWDINATLVVDIIKNLYFPASPYLFDRIPVELLGSIYERYLGKTIRVTETRAIVEDKPEVRKAGGVYYTPKYIVDYIVEQTVGKLIEGKTPKQIEKLRILDPACGSGSFLIGAYRKLLDYHARYYAEQTGKRADKSQPRLLDQHEGGEFKLSLEDKAAILRNNIYGVDIDPQAVEITMMSLYIKILENERGILSGRALLPRLRDNIKCGNSLIGYDIGDLSDEDKARINPFDWESKNEGFGEIMGAGGFDAVIGNPPYLIAAGSDNADYLISHYKLVQYQTDYYVYFIERALSLTRRGCYLSFIVSDAWLNSQYFSNVREHLLSKHKINQIVVFDYPVFQDATMENSILVIAVSAKPDAILVERFSNPTTHAEVNNIEPPDALRRGLIDPHQSSATEKIIAKMEQNSIALENFASLNRGIHAYRTDGYGKSRFGQGPQTKRDKETASYHADKPLNKKYLPELKGKDVFRFSFVPTGRFLSYGDWLAEPREPEFFYNPKITLRKILGRKLHGTFIEEPYALDQSLYVIISKKNDIQLLKYLLGVLLSSVGAWYLRTKYSIYDKLYPWYTKKQLAEFPMKPMNSRMIALVERMLDLHKQMQATKSDAARERIDREIHVTDEQIDALVYELYGLTKEEIKVVEGVDT